LRETRVLAVFSHRPDKVARILPYSGLDYKVITKRIRWSHIPNLVRLILLIPATLWTLLSPLIRTRIKYLIQGFNPDIVFTHGGTTAYKERIAAKTLNKKLVMRLGGHVYEEFKENMKAQGINRMLTEPVYRTHYWFMFQNLRAADHIIVVTQEMKDRLCRENGRNPDTVSVVPVPIAVERYDRPKLTRQTVLSVINLNFMSKLQAMIDYLPVLEEYSALVIAPGRYRSDLAKRTYLNVLGFVKDIESEYQRAAVLCYFSYLDGCRNVVLEAWASRTPVVANRCGWSNELIRDGETGFLVNSTDDARSVIQAVLRSPRIGEKVADRAYEYLLSHHTEEVAGKRLGEVLRRVVCES